MVWLIPSPSHWGKQSGLILNFRLQWDIRAKTPASAERVQESQGGSEEGGLDIQGLYELLIERVGPDRL